MTQRTFRPPESIRLQQIAQQAERATSMMIDVRAAMLPPEARKSAPLFSLTQLAALLGAEKGSVAHRQTRGDLPAGRLNQTGSRREYTLAETRTWVREYRKDQLRPEGAEAVTISVGNFKGGVGKTTTAMTLAQGLSLLGHKVLVIDTDPQGSLTTLFGIAPDVEVGDEQTILPLALGTEKSIRPAIQSTYWDGIDLVAASPTLFGAEFALPARQMKNESFEFWNVLNLGIDDIRADYDVIVIDTPPALSYTTINAFFASNGIVMPLPASALDFASAAQFWNLFSDLSNNLLTKRGLDKAFDFIHVLLSKVDASDPSSGIVRAWIQATYADRVLPIEIPKTAATSTTSTEFATVYDITRYEGGAKTFKRAKDAYDVFVGYVEDSVQTVWRKQEEARKKGAR